MNKNDIFPYHFLNDYSNMERDRDKNVSYKKRTFCKTERDIEMFSQVDMIVCAHTLSSISVRLFSSN